MREVRPRRYCAKTCQAIFLVLLIINLVLFYFVKIMFYSHERNYQHDYVTKPVSWKKIDYLDYVEYRLSRDQTKSIVLYCKDNRIVVPDLQSMSIIRLSLEGKEHVLSNIGINSQLYHVPVVNRDYNPTKEQEIFLKALASAKIITFEINQTKYTWPTANQNELTQCLNR